jgi:membrane protein implicated in regulation of membrane protease activity
VIAVGYFRPASAPANSGSLDIGQTVVFENWVSESDRLARVRYRNSMWDARVLDAGTLESGRVLHIRGVDSNTLHVSVAPV